MPNEWWAVIIREHEILPFVTKWMKQELNKLDAGR